MTSTLHFGGGLIPAVLAGAMSAATQSLVHGAVSPLIVVTLASGTFGVYWIGRFALPGPEDGRAHPDRDRWLDAIGGAGRSVGLAAAVVLPLCLATWASMVRGPRFGVPLVLLAAVSGGYLLLDHRGRWPWLMRPLVIAGVWTAATVWIPAVGDGRAMVVGTGALWLVAARFPLFLGNVLLTDALDAPGDAMAGRRTPATVLGPGRAIAAGRGLLLLAAAAYSGAALASGAAALAAEAGGCLAAVAALLGPSARRLAMAPTGVDAVLLLPPVAALVVATVF